MVQRSTATLGSFRTGCPVRRSGHQYSALLGRLLHDRTADKMARSVSRVRGATAIIMPYDIESRIARAAPRGLQRRGREEVGKKEGGNVGQPISSLLGD
jgi:hypothetical protein